MSPLSCERMANAKVIEICASFLCPYQLISDQEAKNKSSRSCDNFRLFPLVFDVKCVGTVRRGIKLERTELMLLKRHNWNIVVVCSNLQNLKCHFVLAKTTRNVRKWEMHAQCVQNSCFYSLVRYADLLFSFSLLL